MSEYDSMKYKLANSALNVGLWDMEIVNGNPVDPDNKIIWSKEFRKIIGFENEIDFPDVLQSWRDRLHPDDKDATINAVYAHINDHTGRTPLNTEYRFKTKAGGYLWIHAFGDTLRDKTGVPLRIAGAIRDIDDRKKTQNQLMILSNIIQKAPNFIAYKKFDGECLYINHAATVMTGYSHDELMEDYVKLLFGEDGRQKLSDRLNNLKESGFIKYDYEVKLKNGETRIFEGTSFTIESDAYATVATDITDARQNEAERAKSNERLLNVLNGMNAMIYVTDLKTDKILFINNYMKQHFKIKGDVIGLPCYKVFNQGVDKRCDWCPCHRLDNEPDAEIVWEEHNTLTGCDYLNADKYINWSNDMKVHIQHCVDVSDIKQMQKTLEYSNSLLQAVNQSANYLLNSEIGSYVDDLHQSMKVIGEALKVDRVYVWKNHTINGVLHSTQIYEWSEGAESQQNNKYTVNMPYKEALPGLEELFLSGQCLNGIVKEMPSEYQDYFYPQSIVSIIMEPIFLNEQFWGFVGFDDCRNERVFSENEEACLRSVGLLYANAHNRNELIKNIQDTSAQLIQREKLLEAINKATALLLNSDLESFKNDLYQSVKIIAEAVNVDYVYLWENHTVDGNLFCSQIFEWTQEKIVFAEKAPCSYNDVVPGWEKTLSSGKNINSFLRDMAPETQERLAPNGVLSILVVPIFIDDRFWGFVGYDDSKQERHFTSEAERILHSGSLMLVNAWLRNKIGREKEEADKLTKLMLDSSPLSCTLWDKDLSLIDCNDASVKLYELQSKQEFMETFYKYSPEFQPDGLRSIEKVKTVLKKAFDEGQITFDWLHHIPGNDIEIPVEVTLVRIKQKDDYIVAGYTRDLRDITSMERKISRLETEVEKIYINALTGIYNRRFFDENLDRVMKSLSRSDGILSLLMIDIDFFKRYNDTYGHNEGDNCLKIVADVLTKCVTRSDDFVVRYGGEEFAVVLPNTDEEGARLIAEKMLINIRNKNIPHENSDVASYVTISIGAATGKPYSGQSREDFIKRADEMLYESKKSGRNRYTAEH